MSSVRIVTDSTADIPAELASKHGIHIVPLNVHFGSETYKDQTELTSEMFFGKLASDKNHPRTSQPSPGEFAEVYRTLGSGKNSIVSIHLSAQLSGTLQSARLGAESVADEVNVEIIDSKMASMAMGLRALEASRVAMSGASLQEVVETANSSLARSGVFFAVDTLDYLYANGRIGKATHLLGSLLSMKPILTLQDGIVTPYDKVRGKNKVISRLVEILWDKAPKGKPMSIAIAHGNSPDTARSLAKEVSARFNVSEIIISSLGAVIGTHVGPGTVALCYLIPQ